MIMKRIMNKILAICFLGLLCAWNVVAQDITFSGFTSSWSSSIANEGQENECKLTVAEGTVTGDNKGYIKAESSPSYILVSLPRAISTTLDKVAIEVLANNTTTGTYGICAFSKDNITYTNGAEFLLPPNNGPTTTYTFTAPSEAKYYKAGRAATGTVLGGVTLTKGGATVRFYSIKIWLKQAAPLISSFTVNGVAGTIDDENGTITLQLPYGSDLSSLEPEITLGGTAIDYSPKGTQDFTNSATTPIVYTATDGTNTKSYNVTITTPATPPAPQITLSSGSNTQALKVGSAIQDIVYTLTNATGATVNGLPAGLSGSFESTGTNQGTFTISGTIAASETPGTFNYTVTATPIVGYEGSDVTATGTFYVKSATAINICYLVATTTPSATDTRLYPNLYSNPNYYLTIRQAASTAPSPSVYDEFDLIVVNEIITGTNAEIVALKSVDKPILNLKSFVYQSGRWNWGTADNGKSNNGTITVWQPSHPIFNGITLNEGNTLDLLSGAATKGIQPADITNVPGSINVATAPKSTTGNPMAVAIHDVPASARGVTNSKYILIPICNDSYDKMTDAALTLINNAIDYLLHGEQFPAPSLNISSFVVDGKSGIIDNNNNTIITILPLGHGVTGITPAVTLQGVGTIYSPTGAQDFTDSESNPVEYTVTDLINNKIYSVTVKEGTVAVDFPTTKSIFFDGKVLHNPQQVNLKVFDISGRLLVVSNKDIDMSSKAKGVYIVKSEEERMKINVR